MTDPELTSIVNSVLSTLQTHSRTIEGLTPVTTLTDTDKFEISGGRSITYGVLKSLIASMSDEEQTDLRTAINKKELKSVVITTTANSATLTISSIGKDISCTIPVVTTSKAGLMTVEMLNTLNTTAGTASNALSIATTAVGNAANAYNRADAAYGLADTAKANAKTADDKAVAAGSTADYAKTEVDKVKPRVTALEQSVTAANQQLQSVQSDVESINSSKGKPNGIAPLDANAKIPAAHLPGYVDDVVEFNAKVSGISVGDESTKKSTDVNCLVVFNEDTARFVLAVSTRAALGAEDWGNIKRPVMNIATPMALADDDETPSRNSLINDFWQIGEAGDVVLDRTAFQYFAKWADMDSFGVVTADGAQPEGGKVYITTSDNKTYRWSGTTLVAIGNDLALGYTANTAFPGDAGAQMQVQIDDIQDELNVKADVYDLGQLEDAHKATRIRVNGIAIVPFDGFLSENSAPSVGVFFDKTNVRFVMGAMLEGSDYSVWDYNRTVGIDGSRVIPRNDVIFRNDTTLYRYDDEKNGLVEIGGSADGNCLNVTVELPKTDVTTNPYHTLTSAIQAIIAAKRMKLGMQITFAATATTWKQYQYIGSTLDPEGDFKNEKLWNDMAGMSAGKEEIINVNDLCGNGSLSGGAYTLATAITAILAKESESGITYQKPGIVLTYKVADGKWESKQLVQSVNDFGNVAAWKDFGGGGSEVVTKDAPAKGGKDALSTGGAYNTTPVDLGGEVDGNTVKVWLVGGSDKDRFKIGDGFEFIASQGGGGDASGTIVSIAFKDSPLYAALGSTLATKAAIRSVTTMGSNESDNAIVSLELVDKNTKASVWKSNVNKASSPTLKSYTFDIDFTPYISVAGQRDFILYATDDTGKRGQKSISVFAEDLTLSCTQQLGDTIKVSDTDAYVEMYQFANFNSEGGIWADVDMFIRGEWVNIHHELITNAFSKTIQVNAVSLGLTHGAYPIRMQGTSADSGVKGNMVYSTLMVVDPAIKNSTLVAIRYNAIGGDTVRLYDSVTADLAAYRVLDGELSPAIVGFYINNQKIAEENISPGKDVTVRKQISNYSDGDTLLLRGKYGEAESPVVTLTISGSALPIKLKQGASLDIDFSTRSNSESDHTITDHGFTMNVIGSNWNTNGFVDYNGIQTLRIAENVKAHLNYAPFNADNVEQTGAVVQFEISTRNIRDKEAKLISCYDPDGGAGFYVCGNKAVMVCKGGESPIEERTFDSDKLHTIAFVVEPSSVFVEREGTRYSAMKIYIDGEEMGMLGYKPGTGAIFSNAEIDFDGTDGEDYIRYILCYRSYYEWAQAFDNYLVKKTDTAAMVKEYNDEDVLVSQTAEGTTAMRPSAAALWARGIRYMVNIASEKTFDTFDYGNGSDDNGLTTSPKFKGITQCFFDPITQWRSYKAVGVTKKRQGTTSTLRPLKNEDDDYSKATFTPLYPEYASQELLDELWPGLGFTSDPQLRAGLSEEDLQDIENTFRLFKLGYIRIGKNSMPIRKAMNKVDYSDSSCANNGAICDMMNATYRAMGSDYLTPAQRFYDGTWDKGDVHLTGIELNHSIANFPCAIFRSTEETMQNVYFHARGSYMESKKEQAALGFRDVSGYNKGCLNYGDFKELFCAPGQTLDQYVAAADKSSWEYTNEDDEPFNVIVISEYCGRNFRVFRRDNPSSAWRETTGSMKQVNGKWTVTGDVLNPVTGYELLNYTGICWWMGVASVEDMMAPTTAMSSWVSKLNLGAESYPYWTQYFECLIEDDQLAIDYAMGRKVPFELFNTLRFMNSVDYSKLPESQWKSRWKTEAWKFMSIQSTMVYHIFTDYLAAVDQRAKNMQPMWFLEDGAYIEKGVYHSSTDAEPCRMYLNKVYDCDTCNSKDNEGGQTVDAEVDPDKPTDEAAGYKNPYAGWGSILFNDIAKTKDDAVVCGPKDDKGVNPTLNLVAVAQNMRSKQTTITDGRTIVPFSPDGVRYYFIEKRIAKWPKKICTYDCERKYINRTAKANKIYFYAHQGSGRASLDMFVTRRWLVRDGFYQTGGFFVNPLVFRINCRANAKIRITAAARGYFAVGYENIGQISGKVAFLEAGESHEFTEFSHVDGTQLYIYQAARMSRLDISDLTISGADFGKCTLMEELIIGSATHENVALGSFPLQTTLKLGNLPFLHTVDIRNTAMTDMDCSGCPRLAHIKAEGSQLATLALAPTSPINDITLPGAMSDIKIVGLPKLTYTGIDALDGLHIAAYANVNKLRVESSPKIDVVYLMQKIVNSVGSLLSYVRVADQHLKGDGSELLKMIARGVKGMNENGENNRPKPVVIGTYELTRLLEAVDTTLIEASIEGITITLVLEAFIDEIDNINKAYHSGPSEVEPLTLENVSEQFTYYNGETEDDYLDRLAIADKSIHTIINE